MKRTPRSSADRDHLAWPILLILLTVLVPSLGLVWMMREAVRNERLAADQRLREAYEVQLHSAREQVLEQWHGQLAELEQNAGERSPANVFFHGVSQGIADSLLVRDRDGRILYPDAPTTKRLAVEDFGADWQRAQSLEHSQRDLAAAAAAYDQLASTTKEPVILALARQSQIRCLLQLDQRDAALNLLRIQRQDNALCDAQGRSVAAAAELRLLELLDPDSQEWREIYEQLRLRLQRYGNEPLPSSQRRFLMSALQALAPVTIEWPLQDAEALAAEVASDLEVVDLAPALRKSARPDLWTAASPSGLVIALYRTDTLRRRVEQLASGVALPRGVTWRVVAPQEFQPLVIDTSLGESLAGWRIGLATTDDLLGQSSQERQAVHVWIAWLVVAVTCVLGWLLASALRRRLRLAQLKNDLVATVSHELKTPLASIRLLVDTLLQQDGAPRSADIDGRSREYLQLIAQENARLTRLIEHFLTFSRMARGKQRFEFQTLDVREVVRQAEAVVRGRWDDSESFLQVDSNVAAWVRGDLDTLVTAVVNLLENAWKFSCPPRQIKLRLTATDDQVIVAVQDNGIGLSHRAARRVFDRFFQVDQRVARTQEGCGLGLSIVRSIVEAHGGKVQVESRPGKGSTFTLRLPRHDAPATHSTTLATNGEDTV
jgi:signal transduction histidine kinase